MLRIGHRGFPRIAPANTMASFRAARVRGCDWVECDCRASADGVAVLSHDDEIHVAPDDRACRVSRLTAAELSALDLGLGEGVPTLAQLVEWAASEGVGVMADVKAGGIEREIGDALQPLPADRKLVPGADEAGRARFRELFPDLPLSLTVSRLEIFGLNGRLRTADVEAVTLDYPLVSRARIAIMRERGVRVYAWTVDELPVMRALAALGVGGIISNRADLLSEL